MHQVLLLAAQPSLRIPLWVDLSAVVVGGITGAATAQRRGFDLGGALMLAIVMGMGGGVIRDVLIGHGPPAALQDNRYLLAAALAWPAGALFAGLVDRFRPLLLLLDALTLAIYALVGLQKGLFAGLPVAAAILLGVITAAGGGILRDMLSGEVAEALRPGHWNMSAALCGCVLYAALNGVGAPALLCTLLAITAMLALRLGSVRFGWMVPQPPEIAVRRPPLPHRRRKRRSSPQKPAG